MASCWDLEKRWISSMNRMVRPPPQAAPLLRLLDDLAQVGHARRDGADGGEVGVRGGGDRRGPGSSCRCPAAPRGSASRCGRPRWPGAAHGPAPADAPGPRSRPACAGACARRAGRRAAPGRAGRSQRGPSAARGLRAAGSAGGPGRTSSACAARSCSSLRAPAAGSCHAPAAGSRCPPAAPRGRRRSNRRARPDQQHAHVARLVHQAALDGDLAHRPERHAAARRCPGGRARRRGCAWSGGNGWATSRRPWPCRWTCPARGRALRWSTARWTRRRATAPAGRERSAPRGRHAGGRGVVGAAAPAAGERACRIAGRSGRCRRAAAPHLGQKAVLMGPSSGGLRPRPARAARPAATLGALLFDQHPAQVLADQALGQAVAELDLARRLEPGQALRGRRR